MNGKLKEAASHGTIALLYAAGLTLTLFHALGLTSRIGMALPLAAAVVAMMAACSLKRWTSIALAAAGSVGAAVWLLTGGVSVVIETLRGVTLHLSGLTTALPLLAGEAGTLIALLIAVASYLLTFRAAGPYPAMTVLLMALLLLWLGNQAGLLIWLLPSVAAVMTLMAVSAHAGLSLRRVLPMMLAATLAAALAIPTGGVTIGPLKDAADTLRQKIFDYFFFTEPRDVFTLAVEGYYPQGQGQLGGPANPTDRQVMAVVTPRRTYLRGAIKNEYTGRAWLDTTGGRRYLWSGLRWQSIRAETFDMALPQGALNTESSLLQTHTVSVRMLTDSMSSLFLPQRVRRLSPGGDLVPYFNVGSEVFVTRNLQAGDTWSVEAPLTLAGDTGLDIFINACAQVEDPRYESIRATYTALPDHLQQELYDLARRAAGDADTPYAVALALQNYLSRSFRYTLDAAPQPTELDFVTNFLLQTKEGYCTHFASAMTVLCRMMGLPARYVEGYVAVPDAAGRAVVTGLDGHAWTEVYFSGFGWLTFDATPRAGGTVSGEGESSGDTPPEEENTPEPTEEPTTETEEQPTIAPPEATPTPEPEAEDAPQDTPSPAPEPSAEPESPPQEPSGGPNLTWLWLLLLLLLLIAALTARLLTTRPAWLARRARDEEARWMVWTQALYDALRAMKLPRLPNESPMAYMARLDAASALPVKLYGLGQGEAMKFYGRATPQAEATEAVREAYAQIAAAMRPGQKLRMTLRRAFLPKKKLDFTRA